MSRVGNRKEKTKPVEKNKPKKSKKDFFQSLFGLKDKSEFEKTDNNTESKESKGKKEKRKPKRTFWQTLWLIIKICIIVGILAVLGVCIWIYSVIKNTDPIDTSDISSMLSQSSVLYDDQGEIMDTAFSDQNRTLIELENVPMYVRYAFIDLEDKTFETHHGFNFVRMAGAVVDSVLHGKSISGTSTITQQLARNLYLQDTMTKHSYTRKVKEAYYAIILEKNLSKDEILEAYLNTINFGIGYGIQTAATTYFDKSVSDLTLAEAAALAALPQAPSKYALVQIVDISSVKEGDERLIYMDNNYAYIWNETAQGRMQTCLNVMLEQGHISQTEHDEAYDIRIRDMVNPNMAAYEYEANYFADYVIMEVINGLMEEYDYDYNTAKNIVYNGGLKIYTTLNTAAQNVIIKEFENNKSFPTNQNYKLDANNNIMQPSTYKYDEEGNKVEVPSTKIMLYDKKNYVNDKGEFTLYANEYVKNSDGSITIKYGGRLAFYKTTAAGKTDISIEMRSMYEIVKNIFYSIPGGYINIPRKYKSMDANYNVTISADFFKDYPSFFTEDKKGNLTTTRFTLKKSVIQPQAAMTIIENSTGAIKAMVGGRYTTGRMLHNRATQTRQPGSSIKPLSVYGAALQKSFEYLQTGKIWTFKNDNYGQQTTDLYGDYLTASSIIDDEPTTINGRIWPYNWDKQFSGLNTLREAVQQSINVCAVKVLAQVGIKYAYNMVEKFGITTLTGSTDMNLAGLGTGGLTEGVSTLEMASAYSTFANDGVHKSYYSYIKVTTRSGSILLEPEHTETKVLDEGVNFILRDILETVVSEGGAYRAAIEGTRVCGKTGTTNDQVDIWFDGFTPNYSASLWIGSDVSIPMSEMSPKATKLWGKIMSQIPEALGGDFSEQPSNVIQVWIDTNSGQLAETYIDDDGVEQPIDPENSRYEYFIKGTEPQLVQSLEKTVTVCSKSGLLATSSCAHTKEFTGIDRGYTPSPEVLDYDKEVPHSYCEECGGGEPIEPPEETE